MKRLSTTLVAALCGTLGCGDDAQPQAREAFGDRGFSSEAILWDLPNLGWEDGLSGIEGFDSTLMDMNGDGKLDLVITNQPSPLFIPEAPIGWEVYLNTGTGFAESPVLWELPTDGPRRGFIDTSPSFLQFDGPMWSTRDINGDGMPDLVLTCLDDYALFGVPTDYYWKVYLNTGTTFAPAIEWQLPSTDITHGFFAADSSEATNSGDLEGRWTTMDIDGDAQPDLVITGDTTKQVLGHGGSPHWKVHLNTGTGFSDSSMDWTVPKSELPDGFWVTATGAGLEIEQIENWRTEDVTNDGLPDLVFTSHGYGLPLETDEGYVWEVYPNTGSGFAASPTDWVLPPEVDYDNAVDMARGGETARLLGDGESDLVLTFSPDELTFGDAPNQYWKVFEATSTGFETTATTWSVPAFIENSALISNIEFGWGQAPYWGTFDIDGDGIDDLVATSDLDGIFGSASNQHWQVYLGQR